MDVTIRSQAIASGLENELSTIKIIPQLMSRIERHHDVEGPVRKEIVMMALQIIKGRVPPEKQEEIEMLISLASDMIEGVIQFAKAVKYKSNRKGKFCCFV